MELNYSISDRILFSHEMKQLENQICHEHGTKLVDLMDAAALQVAAFIENSYFSLKQTAQPIVVLSGPGNNGGDGLATARLLLKAGFSVKILLTDTGKYSSELSDQIQRYASESIPFFRLKEQDTAADRSSLNDQINEILSGAKLIVDCLLGSGQKGAPRGLIKLACECVNFYQAQNTEVVIVSVDVPTGVDCDCGVVFDPHICPDNTVVIQHLKPGLIQAPAISQTGKIVLVDAGIKSKSTEDIGRYRLLKHESDLIKIKSRRIDSHKGDYGHVLVLGGSPEMPGAACLASFAALRTGTGLVTQLSFNPHENMPFEIMRLNAANGLDSQLLEKLLSRLNQFSCLILGPGLGKAEQVLSFVAALLSEIQNSNVRCILDADGINALSELAKAGMKFNLPSVIITPHPGEAARLLGVSSSEIQANRYIAAEKITETFGTTTILKGTSSICFNGSAGVVNTSGGAYLATAGSGDVLSGMAAAFFASGSNSLEAASKAVFYHGLAGQLAFDAHRGPIIASDIIGKIPIVLGSHVSD